MAASNEPIVDDETPAEAQQSMLLTIKATARALGVSEQLVRKLVKNGELRSTRVGTKLIFIEQRVLDEFIKTGGSPQPNDIKLVSRKRKWGTK